MRKFVREVENGFWVMTRYTDNNDDVYFEYDEYARNISFRIGDTTKKTTVSKDENGNMIYDSIHSIYGKSRAIYNSLGQLIFVNSENGSNKTRYTYFDNGNIKSHYTEYTDADECINTYTEYDEYGNIVETICKEYKKSTDKEEIEKTTWNRKYDEKGRLIEAISSTGSVYTIEYLDVLKIVHHFLKQDEKVIMNKLEIDLSDAHNIIIEFDLLTKGKIESIFDKKGRLIRKNYYLEGDPFKDNVRSSIYEYDDNDNIIIFIDKYSNPTEEDYIVECEYKFIPKK